VSVDDFSVNQTLGAGTYSVTAPVEKVARTATGVRLTLVGSQTTLDVAVDGVEASRVQPGDTVEVLIGRQVKDDAFLGRLTAIVETAPYSELVARIRSAGVSVTPDPGNQVLSFDALGVHTSSYRLGERSDLAFIGATSSAQEASAVVSAVRGQPGDPQTARMSLYVFTPAGYVVGCFCSPVKSRTTIEKLSRLFGPAHAVAWTKE
jgi:hypothetical protein